MDVSYPEIYKKVIESKATGDNVTGIYANHQVINNLIKDLPIQEVKSDPVKSIGTMFGIPVYARDYMATDRILLMRERGVPIIFILREASQ